MILAKTGVKLSKIALALSIIFMASCQTSMKPDFEPAPWKYQKETLQGFEKIATSQFTDRTIEKIKSDYFNDPGETGYETIELGQAFYDPSKDEYHLKFLITYVSDIYAVYVVDDEQNLLRRYLLSEW